ncbi:hypothetical protein PJI17_31550, partial [Mycobacterium kansasii]
SFFFSFLWRKGVLKTERAECGQETGRKGEGEREIERGQGKERERLSAREKERWRDGFVGQAGENGGRAFWVLKGF